LELCLLGGDNLPCQSGNQLVTTIR
jgi:hypothetical protein